MFSAAVRSAVTALALLAAVPDGETRASLIATTALSSPSTIAAAIRDAQAVDANTIVVPLRALPTPLDFDPLAEAIVVGHAAGLKVHASINVAVAAPFGDLPSAREHVVFRHPEWLLVPRTLVDDL